MGKYLYLLFIYLYPRVAKLISPFSQKARLWVEGRKHILDNIQAALAKDTSPRVWFHASSLGEFEQGRPLLEGFKKEYPGIKVILTFFSPSGYESQKNYAQADYVFYMPMDSKRNVARFYEIVKPRCLFLIKYEFWYYYLATAHQNKIPVFLVSGIFRRHYNCFKWYGGWYRDMLRLITHFFVQDHTSAALLNEIGISGITVSGDTRFDRVIEVASHKKLFPEIDIFCGGLKTVIAGSTWHEDEKELQHFAHTHPHYRFIVAPHDISEDRLKHCQQIFKNATIRLSDYKLMLEKNEVLQEGINVLLIDNIGMLKYLYRYATVCMVGGGFRGDGIHNVLEAAVYYKPVLFGPEYEKSLEAAELVEAGGAFDVAGALELEEELTQLIHHPLVYEKACMIAGDYVRKKAGATNQILHYLQEKRLFIS
jgi:3-deoxy-D-manno-octulosonic-acid transferase